MAPLKNLSVLALDSCYFLIPFERKALAGIICKMNATNSPLTFIKNVIFQQNAYLERLNSMPKPDGIDYKYNSISLFSGGGGLDIGAAWGRFRVDFASDLEQEHCNTIASNFPDCVTLPANVQDLTGKKVKELSSKNEFDLLIGGPPCQAFSILGRRNSFSDPRGKLVYEYARLVKELKPRAFVFENVPGLMTVNKGEDWKELLQYFEDETGYKIFHSRLNAADFGVPQIRIRVFIVGFRNQKAEFEFPVPTHHNPEKVHSNGNSKLNWIPAKYALESLDGVSNHRIRPHGDRVRNRYSQIPQGGRDRVDHTDRIHPDKPSGTVIVGSRAGGGRPHIHPDVPRHISVREAARLQSFPDWYVFQNTETWQYRAVGNAVPPLLGKAVCDSIAKTLDELSNS